MAKKKLKLGISKSEFDGISKSIKEAAEQCKYGFKEDDNRKACIRGVAEVERALNTYVFNKLDGKRRR